jgi:hypothetical protein
LITAASTDAQEGEITNEQEALAAVRQDGEALEYVPNELKTAELCLEAMKCCGIFLSHVPKKVLTAEICFEATKHDSYAYREGRFEKVDRVEKEVPEELRDGVRSMLASWLVERKNIAD